MGLFWGQRGEEEDWVRKEEGGAKPRNEFCMVRPPGVCFCIVVLGHGSLLVAVYYIFA